MKTVLQRWLLLAGIVLPCLVGGAAGENFSTTKNDPAWTDALLKKPPPGTAPPQAGPVTDKTPREIHTAWCLRQFYAPFLKSVAKNPEWSDTDRQTVRRMILAFARDNILHDTLGEPLLLEYRALHERFAGQDPLIDFLHCWSEDTWGSWDNRHLPEYESILARLKQSASPYPAALAHCVALAWSNHYSDSMPGCGRQTTPEIDGTILLTLLRAIDRGDYQPGEEHVLLEHLIADADHPRLGANLWFENKAKSIAETIAARAGVHDAVKATLLGYAANLAGDHAGAEKHFTAAWTLRPDLPHAAALMVKNCRDGGDTRRKTRLWFDRAVAAQPDFLPAYERYHAFLATRDTTASGIRRRLEFGRACAAQGGVVAKFHLNSIASLWLNYPAERRTPEFRDAWTAARETEIKRLAETEAWGMTFDLRLTLAKLACVSWMLGDYPGGKNFIEALGKYALPARDTYWIDGLAGSRNRVFAECHLFTTPALDTAAYQKAMRAFDAGNYAEASTQLTAIRVQYDGTPHCKAWIDEAIKTRAER